jgi:hypothetical protein
MGLWFDPVGHQIYYWHLSELACIYKVLGSVPHSSHYFFTEPFLAEVVLIVFLLNLFSWSFKLFGLRRNKIVMGDEVNLWWFLVSICDGRWFVIGPEVNLWWFLISICDDRCFYVIEMFVQLGVLWGPPVFYDEIIHIVTYMIHLWRQLGTSPKKRYGSPYFL